MSLPSFSSSSRSLIARRVGGLVAALAVALGAGACRTASSGTTLEVRVPEADRDADLFVDGHYVGQVKDVGPEPVGPVMLAPGVHRVEVRKAGRFPVQRTVRVDAQTPKQTVVDAELLEDPQ